MSKRVKLENVSDSKSNFIQKLQNSKVASYSRPRFPDFVKKPIAFIRDACPEEVLCLFQKMGNMLIYILYALQKVKEVEVYVNYT